MKNQRFRPEFYPIVVQVIAQNGIEYLSLFQPDFNYRVIEAFRPRDMGQTEMMIIKMRRELESKASQQDESPSPSKSAALFKVPERNKLSTKQVARLLGISESSIRRMVESGAIKCTFTQGGHRRFDPSVIDAVREIPETETSPALEGNA